MKTKRNRQPRPYAVVVTGTPGTGKTVISKSLARQLHANYLPLTKLVIARRLYAGVDQERRTKVVDLKRTRAWLRKSLHKGEEITIVDTHVPDAIPRELVGKVVVLRCHPSVLEARLRKKGWRVLKVRENVLAEILDSCYAFAASYHGADKIVELDTSRASVSKTVNKCRTLLKKHPKGNHRVDWIATLDKRVLERYMP